MQKHSFSSPTSSELPTVDLALSTLMQQITFKTYSIRVTSIYNRVFTLIPYTSQVQGFFHTTEKREKSLNTYKKESKQKEEQESFQLKSSSPRTKKKKTFLLMWP